MMILIPILIILLALAFTAFAIITMWKVYAKAGQPGWAIFVPIYSFIVMLKIVNKPWWWIFLMLIPIANLVFAIIILNRVSLSFGKGTGFTVGLVFLGIIFWAILAFDSSVYKKIEDAPVAA